MSFTDYSTYASRLSKCLGGKVSEECAIARFDELPREYASASDYTRAMLEYNAFENGNPPVFRLYRNLARTLAECEFNLLVDDWRTPFPSFIVLVESGSGITIGGYPEDSSRYTLNEITSLLFTTSVTQGDRFGVVANGIGREQRPGGIEEVFPVTGSYRGNRVVGESVQQLFDGCRVTDQHGVDYTSESITRDAAHSVQCWLRIIIGVSLLATSGDKNIEPDILSKDMQRYIEAKRQGDETRAKALADRCERRRGYKCFAVGRDVTIRELYGHQGDGDCDESGRHLNFQHLRRAHFRKTHSGKVVFIRHTIVRPDLPSANTKIEYQLS